MRRAFLVSLFLLSCTYKIYSQQIVNYAQLDQIINNTKDSVVVVNFWATWCKPCLEELPYFVEANQQLKGEPVKFLFVSMDFTSKKDKAKETFLKYKLPGSFVLLNEDPNAWINKVNPDWAGEIPYTFVRDKKGNRTQYPKPFASSDELINLAKNALTK